MGSVSVLPLGPLSFWLHTRQAHPLVDKKPASSIDEVTVRSTPARLLQSHLWSRVPVEVPFTGRTTRELEELWSQDYLSVLP